MTLLVILTLFSCKNVVEDTEHYRINPEDCFTKPHNNLGFVPDKETAAKIAVAVWTPIYGEKEIKSEKPYNIWLMDDSIWVVYGSLQKNALGGTAYVEIRKSDGAILRMTHEQ